MFTDKDSKQLTLVVHYGGKWIDQDEKQVYVRGAVDCLDYYNEDIISLVSFENLEFLLNLMRPFTWFYQVPHVDFADVEINTDQKA